MKLGTKVIFIFCFITFFQNAHFAFSEEKIKTVPLINLEELSPTFEEEKEELEKIEIKNNSTDDIQSKLIVHSPKRLQDMFPYTNA